MMKTTHRPAAIALLAVAALLASCGKNPGVGGAAGDAMPGGTVEWAAR